MMDTNARERKETLRNKDLNHDLNLNVCTQTFQRNKNQEIGF